MKNQINVNKQMAEAMHETFVEINELSTKISEKTAEETDAATSF